MPYALQADGSWRMIADKSWLVAGETLSDAEPPPAPIPAPAASNKPALLQAVKDRAAAVNAAAAVPQPMKDFVDALVQVIS